MGNCNPWCQVTHRNAEKQEQSPSGFRDEVFSPPKRLDKESPLRYGVEGLEDCGFEYRTLSRPTNDLQEQRPLDNDFLPNIRLFHVTTGVMITDQNRPTYIPDGLAFDQVMACCQQIVQDRLCQDYGLEWKLLYDCEGVPIRVLATPDVFLLPNPILLVLTGKGKSRAGILSVRELLVSGMVQGSAMYHVHQALRRKWSVLLFDPNARGKTEGLTLIRDSLNHLPWDQLMAQPNQQPIYVLAHSASGGYLVHYLLEEKYRKELLHLLGGLCFTDSTHNLQWANKDPPVAQLLESKRVLYIRNCSEHPSDTFANHKHKIAGGSHEGNQWWYRRFGQIPCVWGGTTDHAAICWAARKVIWNFFDERHKQLAQHDNEQPRNQTDSDPEVLAKIT